MMWIQLLSLIVWSALGFAFLGFAFLCLHDYKKRIRNEINARLAEAGILTGDPVWDEWIKKYSQHRGEYGDDA